jgi:hypothetical protein
MHVAAANSAVFFTNPFNIKATDGTTLCGLINNCVLKQAGCVNAYTIGNAVINQVTGEVTMKKNVDAGYEDILCVECKNTANSVITFDNWKVTQLPNCNTLTASSITAKEYGYDNSQTSTVVYRDSQVFANSKATAVAPLVACPILNCVLLQSDCTTALVAPFDTKLTIDSVSPWYLRISQTQVTGYPNVAVCYKCNNGYGTYNQHTITSQVTIRQKIDCTTALGGGVNSTSSLIGYYDPAESGVRHAAKVYAASPQYVALAEFDLGSKMFSNVNAADCGDFTQCYPMPVGCTGTYAGRVGIDGT